MCSSFGLVGFPGRRLPGPKTSVNNPEGDYFTYAWTSELPKTMAQDPKIERIGSRGSILLGILEIQVFAGPVEENASASGR